jgi:hypothetical protein
VNKPDGYKAALLDFLTDNLVGRERDAVIRAFYEYAEGDPHSHPVGMAVLLTACARQMARLPDNVRSGAREFQGILDKLLEVDKELGTKIANHQIQWKADLNHAVIGFAGSIHGETSRTLAALEVENARAEATWNQVVQQLNQALEEADQVNRRLVPIADSAREIARIFASLKVELKLHEESDQRTFDAVASLKTIHEENQKQGQDTQALIKSLTKEARVNWMTIGFLCGAIFTGVCEQAQMAPWIVGILLVIGAGLLQRMARQMWNLIGK